MKVIVPRAQLTEALNIAATISPAKPPNPVLTNACLEASKAGLQLRATDLDFELVRNIAEADVKKVGVTLADCRLLRQAVASLPGEAVTLELAGTELRVSSGFDLFEMATADPADYPAPRALIDAPSARLTAAELAEALRVCAGSLSTDKGQYALNGMLIDPQPIHLEFVGSNGRIISYLRQPAVVEMPAGGLPHQTVVPVAGIAALARTCAALGAEEITLRFFEQSLVLQHRDYQLWTALVWGRYPDWRSVVEDQAPAGPHAVYVSRPELQAAIERAALMTTKDSDSVTFDVAAGRITLAAASAQRGKGTASCAATYDGEPLRFCLRDKYALKALADQGADQVVLQVGDAGSSVYFHTGDMDQRFSMVMPIEL